MSRFAEDLDIAVAQINTTVGDIAGNLKKCCDAWDRAGDVDLVVTPELSLSGYPLEDLVEDPELLEACQGALGHIIEKSKSMPSGIVVSLPVRGAQNEDGRNIYNTAYLIEGGRIVGQVAKHELPTYDVFDERRNFAPGPFSEPIPFRGTKIGLLVCEDTWFDRVSANLAGKGAQMLLSINSSPYETGKWERRLENVVRRRASETGLPVLYVNQVGGQDEVVFDGGSMAVNSDGDLVYRGATFEEGLDLLTFSARNGFAGSFAVADGQTAFAPLPSSEARDYAALVLGTRDYCRKAGLTKAVLGMSGGIDSALVAAIAVDALGGENVHLFSLPSQYTAADSNTDAEDATRRLGAHYGIVGIEPAVHAFEGMLKDFFNASALDVADENLQSRVRGVTLMYIVNKLKGATILSTGNKSEASVGYCTIYGDTNGGFNPIKDLYKMHVYALSKWRNVNHMPWFKGPAGVEVVPAAIIAKEPSAELRTNQKDSDSLPPYPVLDEILRRYIEGRQKEDRIARDMADAGVDKALVQRMTKLVDFSEWKRRQMCMGVKIGSRNFGRGRRMPVARLNRSDMIASTAARLRMA